MTIFDSFHSFIVATKISIIGVACVLDPTLITNIFALQSWILISVRPTFLFYKNRLINCNGKERDWLVVYNWGISRNIGVLEHFG